VRLGLWGARPNDRGLGIQTWEFFRHLRPACTLVALVDSSDLFGLVADRFPRAWQTSVEKMPEIADDFLSQVDVVLCAETPYWEGLWEMARARGVATALQYNRELLPESGPRPDLMISPSTWRLADVPEAVHLPLPVDRKRLPFRERAEVRSFLHVVSAAMKDRDGTGLVLSALPHLREPTRVILHAPAGLAFPLPKSPPHVEVEVRTETVKDYWRIYEGADVLLLPRRYGGQSLPLNEAASLGMPVIALDVEPQRSILPPQALIPATPGHYWRMKGGTLPVHNANPRELAAKMDELSQDPGLVRSLSRASDAYAARISWDALLPTWRATLEALAARKLEGVGV
jgi:glycosyltransferase involved in cell wall biosynthesis